MTKFILTASFIFSANAYAADCTKWSGVVVGQVAATEVYGSSCKVFVTEDSTITPDDVCPIDEKRVRRDGIEVGLHKEDVCSFQKNEFISGIIEDNGVTISL